MLRYLLIPLISFLIIAGLFVFTENQIAPQFESCVAHNTANQTNENAKGPIVTGLIKAQWICTLRLVDRHNGFFAALAGIAVAAFTFTLWVATDQLARSGQRIFEATERAFVFLDGFNYELSLATDRKEGPDYEHLPEWYKSHPELFITRFAVQPKWKNSGNTPTKKMTIRVNFAGPRGEVPPSKYVYRGPQAIPFFLGPNAIEPSEVIEMPGAIALVDWQLSPSGPEPMILIWGRADYEDVFGKKHFIEWCHQLRFSRPDRERLRASFTQWREHNRTDEDQQIYDRLRSEAST
jgi:hypothetical protein